MTNKNYIEAYDAAQQEHQNKEKEFVKSLVKNYLEKIDTKQKEKNKIEEEIQFYRKQLDYLKEGKLDKIEEMAKIVPQYEDWSPIKVTCEHNGKVPNSWLISSGYTSVNGQTIKR